MSVHSLQIPAPTGAYRSVELIDALKDPVVVHLIVQTRVISHKAYNANNLHGKLQMFTQVSKSKS